MSPFCWIEDPDDAAEKNDTSDTYTSVAWCNDITKIPSCLLAKTLPHDVASQQKVRMATNLTMRTTRLRIDIKG
jgi:hypothetical protein